MDQDDDFQVRSRKRPRSSKPNKGGRNYACPAKGIVSCDIRVDNRGVCEDHAQGLFVDFDRCRLSLVTEFPNQRYRKLALAGKKEVAFRTFAYAFDEWALIVFEDAAGALDAEKFMREHYLRPSEKHLHLLPLSPGETLPLVSEWINGKVPFDLDKNERKFRPRKLLAKWRDIDGDAERKAEHMELATGISSPVFSAVSKSASRSRSRSSEIPAAQLPPSPSHVPRISVSNNTTSMEDCMKRMSHHLEGLRQVQRQLRSLSSDAFASNESNAGDFGEAVPVIPSILQTSSFGSTSLVDETPQKVSPEEQEAVMIKHKQILAFEQQKLLFQLRNRELLRRIEQQRQAASLAQRLQPPSSSQPAAFSLVPGDTHASTTNHSTPSNVLPPFMSTMSLADSATSEAIDLSRPQADQESRPSNAVSTPRLVSNMASSGTLPMSTDIEDNEAAAMDVAPPVDRSDSLNADSALQLDSMGGLAGSTISAPFNRQNSLSSISSRQGTTDFPPMFRDRSDLNLPEMDLYNPTTPAGQSLSTGSHNIMRGFPPFDKHRGDGDISSKPTSICAPLVKRVTSKDASRSVTRNLFSRLQNICAPLVKRVTSEDASRSVTRNLFSRLQNAVWSWWSTVEVMCHVDHSMFRMYTPGTMRQGVDAASSSESFSMSSVKNVAAMPAPDTSVFRVTVEKSESSQASLSSDPVKSSKKAKEGDKSNDKKPKNTEAGGGSGDKNLCSDECVYEFVAATEADRDRWVSFLRRHVKP